MKTYRGTPGDPPKVTCETDNGIALLSPDRRFAWGDGSIGAADLARAIIEDVLGDENEAIKLMMRFKHRVVASWRAGEPWTITDGEVRGVIEEIRKVERETAQARAMVAREPRPVVMEGGQGIGWKSAPDIIPNNRQMSSAGAPIVAPMLALPSNNSGLVPGRAYDELGILSVPCMVPPDSPFSVENLKKAKASNG